MRGILSLRRQADTPSRAIFLEDAAEDDAFIDARFLFTILDDIVTAIEALFQDAEMELPLPTDIVGEGLGLCDQGVGALRVEYLGSPRLVELVSHTIERREEGSRMPTMRRSPA